jgi:hypothetical protein
MSRCRILTVVLALGLAVAACGDDADQTTGRQGEDPGATSTVAGGGDAPEGEVPDPCALLDEDEVDALLGADAGTGSVNAVVPEQRKVCMYSGGVSLAIEVAEHYEASVEIIRDDPVGATIEDVEGVGAEAIWQDFTGGVGQILARGDDYFVGVSVVAGGLPTAQALAEAMLAAL